MADFNIKSQRRNAAIAKLNAKFAQFKTDRSTIALPSFFYSLINPANPDVAANQSFHTSAGKVFQGVDDVTLEILGYFAEFIDSLPLT
jgi:hypothetical protein